MEKGTSRFDTVHYVVVVHGMGEPKRGNTIRPVIDRFAEARQKTRHLKATQSPLALGMILGQIPEAIEPPVCRTDGTWDALPPLWMEYEGIPRDGDLSYIPFRGLGSTTGHNIRFSEIYWGDITGELFEQAGEEVNIWTKSLTARMREELLEIELIQSKKGKDLDATDDPFRFAREIDADDAKTQRFLYEVLDNVCRLMIPLEKGLNLRAKNISDLVFNRFLGDVQLFAEYVTCRDKAVHRFQHWMDALVASHWQHEDPKLNRKPVFHIIAHSLGTVMSLHTLVNEAQKESKTSWIHNVESFVTLGSPIDKFLLIWPGISEYQSWEQPLVNPIFPRIRHYNLCDEQDPVGHYLNSLYKKPLIQSILGEKTVDEQGNAHYKAHVDQVYVRYPIAGKAHVDYWTDQALFDYILSRTVDYNAPPPEENPFEAQTAASIQQTEPENPDDLWFNAKRYKKVLDFSYFWVAAGFGILLSVILMVFTFQGVFAQNPEAENTLLSLDITHLVENFYFSLYWVVSALVIEVAWSRWANWGRWRSSELPSWTVKILVGLGAILLLVAVFLHISLRGVFGLTVYGIFLGTTWLYFRIMELLIQWRRISSKLKSGRLEVGAHVRRSLRNRFRFQISLRAVVALGLALWIGYEIYLLSDAPVTMEASRTIRENMFKTLWQNPAWMAMLQNKLMPYMLAWTIVLPAALVTVYRFFRFWQYVNRVK